MMSGGKFEHFWAKYGHMHGLMRTCWHDLLQQGWCCTLRIYFRAGNTMKHALGLKGFQIFLAGRIWWPGGIPGDCYRLRIQRPPGSSSPVPAAGQASKLYAGTHWLSRWNGSTWPDVGDMSGLRSALCVAAASLDMPSLAGWKDNTIISRSRCWDLILRFKMIQAS